MTTTKLTPSWRISEKTSLSYHAVWYIVAGIVTTGLQTVLFLIGRPELGSIAANLVAIAVTTILNTEFHRRVTFAGAPNHPARRYTQSLLTFIFYACYGSAVLALMKVFLDQPSAAWEATALVFASLIGGTVRFFLLRLWVFTHKTARVRG